MLSAPCSTVSGRATHFIRDGRISESSRSRMLSIVSSRTSDAGWPVAISSSTSADAAEMAQQSPVHRPSTSRPSARFAWMRTRSPQSGFTSSPETSGRSRVPRYRGRRNRSRMTLL